MKHVSYSFPKAYQLKLKLLTLPSAHTYRSGNGISEYLVQPKKSLNSLSISTIYCVSALFLLVIKLLEIDRELIIFPLLSNYAKLVAMTFWWPMYDLFWWPMYDLDGKEAFNCVHGKNETIYLRNLRNFAELYITGVDD